MAREKEMTKAEAAYYKIVAEQMKRTMEQLRKYLAKHIPKP